MASTVLQKKKRTQTPTNLVILKSLFFFFPESPQIIFNAHLFTGFQ